MFVLHRTSAFEVAQVQYTVHGEFRYIGHRRFSRFQFGIHNNKKRALECDTDAFFMSVTTWQLQRLASDAALVTWTSVARCGICGWRF